MIPNEFVKSAPPGKVFGKDWPSWRYGPNGEAQIFQRAEDVPEGWKDVQTRPFVQTAPAVADAPDMTRHEAIAALRAAGADFDRNASLASLVQKVKSLPSADEQAAAKKLAEEQATEQKLAAELAEEQKKAAELAEEQKAAEQKPEELTRAAIVGALKERGLAFQRNAPTSKLFELLARSDAERQEPDDDNGFGNGDAGAPRGEPDSGGDSSNRG